MIVLVDTNVVFDVIGKRQPYYSASNQIMSLCRRRALVGAIAFHTVANIFYAYGRKAEEFVRERLLPSFSVHGATSQTILDILQSGMNDLEDALHSAAAHTAAASFIITRNTKDFKFSPVPALDPAEFLKRFHPD